MRLRDVMSDAVETVVPDATAANARNAMTQKDVRHLVVVDDGDIVGVLSEHDLRGIDGGAHVRALMSSPPVTTLDTTVRDAANLMRGNRVGCLPVVDGERRLVGMVTRSDLLDFLGKGVTREQIDRARHRSFVPVR
ncbi:MAG TPA: CBS domain-containing protein [Myxococcales bacterium]|nr:CBS domain-containing protein [Myxococcales bacterium]